MTFSLKLTRLKATLYFPQYHLPPWLGNKFRGGFGSVLLKAVCGYIKPACNICRSTEDCLYYALYVKDRQRRGKSQPVRPIVFIPPFFGKRVEGRGEITVEINIFGDYIRYLLHIIYGLRFLGKVGLNATSRYELLSIADAFTGRKIYDGESVKVEKIKTVDLGDLTPVSLDGIVEVSYITPIEAYAPIQLPFLIHLIRRRLILYVNEYGSGEVPAYKCGAEILESEWRRHKLIHLSKRQGKRSFYAITGSATYRVAEADENTLKLLAIGKLIGAGAKASFGMGFFKIDTRGLDKNH
jgi:CRISPR-associated endoribonuclease Cas6